MKADANVYAFDFSTIDFCLNVFCGRNLEDTRKVSNFIHCMSKGFHTGIVLIIHVKVHDVNILDELSYEKGKLLYHG